MGRPRMKIAAYKEVVVPEHREKVFIGEYKDRWEAAEKLGLSPAAVYQNVNGKARKSAGDYIFEKIDY